MISYGERGTFRGTPKSVAAAAAQFCHLTRDFPAADVPPLVSFQELRRGGSRKRSYFLRIILILKIFLAAQYLAGCWQMLCFLKNVQILVFIYPQWECFRSSIIVLCVQNILNWFHKVPHTRLMLSFLILSSISSSSISNGNNSNDLLWLLWEGCQKTLQAIKHCKTYELHRNSTYRARLYWADR